MLPTRVLCVVISGSLALMLGTAATLTPDPRGHRTHEQLGLPPCTFATLAGWRCPGCGMTTAWSHLTHGSLASAIRTHASGTMLGFAAVIGSGWCLAYTVAGPGRVRLPKEQWLLAAGLGIAMLVLVEWVIKLSEQGFSFAA